MEINEKGRKMSKDEEYWKNIIHQSNKLYKENTTAIKKILINNRGYVYEIPRDEYVILLYSGGLDSSILIDMLIRKWNCKVILLYFKRGAKNQKWEEIAVDFFNHFYLERFPDNIVECLKLDIEIPSRINKEHLDRTRQKIMGLPLRNATMWDNAFTQAVYLSSKYDSTIRTIIVGSIKEDEGSPESGSLSVLSQTLHACTCMSIWYYQVLAPFLDGSFERVFDKVDIIEYAKKWQIPIENSRSCFESSEAACNQCLACVNRNKAHLEFEMLQKNKTKKEKMS